MILLVGDSSYKDTENWVSKHRLTTPSISVYLLCVTYINDLEKFTIGVENKHLVLAILSQQNIVLHHQSYK